MKPGILVISHGSRESGWVALVDETVEAARTALRQLPGCGDLPVEAAFLELVEGRLIQNGVDRLEASGVESMLAIPLFVSSGSTHVDEIGWALGAYAACRTKTDLPPVRVSAELTYGKPIDDAPELGDVLLDRLAKLSGNGVSQPEMGAERREGSRRENGVPVDGNEPSVKENVDWCSGESHSQVSAAGFRSRESVLLIAHGSDVPGFHEDWRRGMVAAAADVCRRGGYADAETAMLRTGEVAERYAQLRERRPHDAVLAVPLFLSKGYFTSTVIPKALAGLDCRYDGATLMPHHRIADWVVRQAREWIDGLGLSGDRR